jgi:hypothetical protein
VVVSVKHVLQREITIAALHLPVVIMGCVLQQLDEKVPSVQEFVMPVLWTVHGTISQQVCKNVTASGYVVSSKSVQKGRLVVNLLVAASKVLGEILS